MSKPPSSTATRQYPLPRQADDSRFTYGLLHEVCTVLELHGYPRPTGGDDLVDLHLALFRFLYAPAEEYRNE